MMPLCLRPKPALLERNSCFTWKMHSIRDQQWYIFILPLILADATWRPALFLRIWKNLKRQKLLLLEYPQTILSDEMNFQQIPIIVPASFLWPPTLTVRLQQNMASR